MVKRICPDCSSKSFSAAEQEEWECRKCGRKLGTELNMAIGAFEAGVSRPAVILVPASEPETPKSGVMIDMRQMAMNAARRRGQV
jgi:hypothetical protein